ncbi:MAG: hypothetical protein KAI83_06965 [Thiomargarita sp.]|nr:hypothetical protein [Thiomargarita sp.]
MESLFHARSFVCNGIPLIINIVSLLQQSCPPYMALGALLLGGSKRC